MNQQMKISDVGIELIKHFEGLHDGDLNAIGLQPKLCPAGIYTIGYGKALVNPKTGKYIKTKEELKLIPAELLNMTEKDAVKLLAKELIKVESIVNKLIKVKLLQHQFDALVSHTYNCGVSDTLYNLVNKMPLGSESLEIWWKSKYITAGGKKLNGLIKRRAVEYELFRTGKLNLK
jgi:lysozyme